MIGMGKKRYIVASASSVFWPAVVFVIPMGLTFASARVYAESGVAPPPECTSASVTACADAAAQQACECGGGDCACITSRCVGAAGAIDSLECKAVTTCSAYAVADCKGKTAGASCVQVSSSGGSGPTGTCVVLANGCLEKGDAGFYETAQPLACDAPLNGADGGATNGADGTGGDSGCALTPGADAPFALFAAPVAIGLLLTRRRRRRR